MENEKLEQTKLVNEEKTEEKTKPLFTDRQGAIQLSVWEKKTKEGNLFKTAQITKSYLKKDGDVKNPSDWVLSNSWTKKNLQDLLILVDRNIKNMD